MKKALPKLTLVLGGAASGKTSWAEALAVSSGMSPVYFATARALDDEMGDKIARHRAARGPTWRTVECPDTLAEAVGAHLGKGEVAVVDCLTLWLTNLVMAEADVEAATTDLLSALDDATTPVVLVSNELGLGLVPADAMSRRFRNLQGRLNQTLAARCDLVVLVTAGLPLVLKGALPE